MVAAVAAAAAAAASAWAHPLPPRRLPSRHAGIVQGTATIRNVDRKTEFCSFDIELPAARADNVAIGASVAINGTCLTVVEQRGATLRFDVMAETLRRTNLGALDAGSAVNFERSARVGDEIGGHTVSGHVHTTARIVKVEDTENNRRLVFEVGAVLAGLVVLLLLLLLLSDSWQEMAGVADGHSAATATAPAPHSLHPPFLPAAPHAPPPTHTHPTHTSCLTPPGSSTSCPRGLCRWTAAA